MGDGLKVLLDTCVFIWLVQAPSEISGKARKALDNPESELWLSHASVWEVNLKHLAGKLTLPEKPRLWFSRQMAIWGIKDQPLDLESLYLSSELPPLHKDPFDRLVVAQAIIHDAVLVSPDPILRKYGATVLW